MRTRDDSSRVGFKPIRLTRLSDAGTAGPGLSQRETRQYETTCGIAIPSHTVSSKRHGTMVTSKSGCSHLFEIIFMY
jgi:hypothetical protein